MMKRLEPCFSITGIFARWHIEIDHSSFVPFSRLLKRTIFKRHYNLNEFEISIWHPWRGVCFTFLQTFFHRHVFDAETIHRSYKVNSLLQPLSTMAPKVISSIQFFSSFAERCTTNSKKQKVKLNDSC